MPMPDGGYEFASGDVRGMRAKKKITGGFDRLPGQDVDSPTIHSLGSTACGAPPELAYARC